MRATPGAGNVVEKMGFKHWAWIIIAVVVIASVAGRIVRFFLE